MKRKRRCMRYAGSICLCLLTITVTVEAAEVTWAGFRSSIYGAGDPFPEPETWEKASKTIAANFSPHTQPAVTWIVGTVNTGDPQHGGLQLEMTRPGPQYQDIRFVDDPHNGWAKGYPDHDKWLTYFDRQGIRAILQVEPGHSEMLPIIRLVMETWGQHDSVIGFGVDIEWYRNSRGSGGGSAAVSAATLVEWLDALHQYTPDAKLMVKHWDADNLADGSVAAIPQDKRQFLIFCNDSQGSGSVEYFMHEMTAFARAYEDGEHSADVWFQIGYKNDWWTVPRWAPENAPWFYTLKDGWEAGKDGIPLDERGVLPKVLGERLAEAVSPHQRVGIIWVDFTMTHLYPAIFQ